MKEHKYAVREETFESQSSEGSTHLSGQMQTLGNLIQATAEELRRQQN